MSSLEHRTGDSVETERLIEQRLELETQVRQVSRDYHEASERFCALGLERIRLIGELVVCNAALRAAGVDKGEFIVQHPIPEHLIARQPEGEMPVHITLVSEDTP